MEDEDLINSGILASNDLKIQIQTPFVLNTGEGSDCTYLLLIKKFGSKLGTIIITTRQLEKFYTPEKFRYYCSALNPSSYSVYKRNHFIETLKDWGFFGSSNEKPHWYNGHVYNN